MSLSLASSSQLSSLDILDDSDEDEDLTAKKRRKERANSIKMAEVDTSALSSAQTQLVIDHWSSFNQADQRKVVEDMFQYIFTHYPQMKPIWTFGRGKLGLDFQKVRRHHRFKQHVAYVMKNLDLVVTHLDTIDTLKSALVSTGFKHFYYDASEHHFAVIGESLIESFRKNSKMDQATREAWLAAYGIMTEYIEMGLRKSRNQYLLTAITADEMHKIKTLWKQVEHFGLREAGISLCGAAFRAYQELIKEHNQEDAFAIEVDTESQVFSDFSQDVIQALQVTIDAYAGKSEGFTLLPPKLKQFSETYMGTEVSPVLVRKAFTEGLTSTLELVLSKTEDAKLHCWTKLYRVMEQGIMYNIVSM